MSASLQKKVLDTEKKEKVVFAFSLFGSNKKYTEGMIANAQMITKRLPDARIQIYIADDVPTEIVDRLSQFPSVRLVNVKRKQGTPNTFDRFSAIDNTDCDVMFSRDADSRVHERDMSCIEDFLSSDKLLHIIRDHKGHNVPILAGMWGLRKKALTETMHSMVDRWVQMKNNPSHYGCDQQFLWAIIYPKFIHSACIHDSRGHFRDTEKDIRTIRYPIVDTLFVGQVHDYSDTGDEILAYGL